MKSDRVTAMRRFFDRLIPFILFGIAVVAFIYGIVLLAYLFLFGAIVGCILFFITWLRRLFFTNKSLTKKKSTPPGRIIDSDDWRVH
jgi:hypothetical protein